MFVYCDPDSFPSVFLTMTPISVQPLRPSARSNQSCKEPFGQAIIREGESTQACPRSVHKMVMEGRFDLFRQCTVNWIKSYSVDGLPLSGLKLSDWLLLPIVEEVLDEPDSVSLTMQHITDELEPFIADAVQKWYKERREELLSQLGRIRSLSDMPKDFDLLQLAVHTFDCVACHERFMPFPDVIVHRCAHVPYVRERGQKDSSYTSLVNGYLGRQLNQPVAWSPDLVRVNTRLYPDKVNALIQKFGSRPDTATHYDMERQRKRVVCDECSEQVERGRPRFRKYEVFDWKRALFHQDSERHVDSDTPCTWKIMPMEVSERVREFERDAEAMEPHYRRVKKYTCCPCGACFWHHKAELFEHLRSKHEIEEAKARHDVDYHEQVTVVKIDGLQLEGVYFSYLHGRSFRRSIRPRINVKIQLEEPN